MRSENVWCYAPTNCSNSSCSIYKCFFFWPPFSLWNFFMVPKFVQGSAVCMHAGTLCLIYNMCIPLTWTAPHTAGRSHYFFGTLPHGSNLWKNLAKILYFFIRIRGSAMGRHPPTLCFLHKLCPCIWWTAPHPWGWWRHYFGTLPHGSNLWKNLEIFHFSHSCTG